MPREVYERKSKITMERTSKALENSKSEENLITCQQCEDKPKINTKAKEDEINDGNCQETAVRNVINDTCEELVQNQVKTQRETAEQSDNLPQETQIITSNENGGGADMPETPGKTGDHVRNNREESSGGDPAITALGNDPVVKEISGGVSKSEMNTEANSREKPPWCQVIFNNLPLLVDRLNDVAVIALRLLKRNIMSESACDSIVKNLTREGVTSAGEELLMFMLHDPDQVHHITFYQILEDLKQTELAQMLRTQTQEIWSARQCGGANGGAKRKNMKPPCLVNPKDLIASDIDEQISEGRSAVHIAVGFAADSIVRVLKDSDLHQILTHMQKRFILQLEDFIDLKDVMATSGNIKCIEKLNVLLQKTSNTKLLKFVTILNQMGPWECELGNFVNLLLTQCDEQFLNMEQSVPKVEENQEETEKCLIPARIKVRSTGLTQSDSVLVKLNKLPEDLLDIIYVKVKVGEVNKGCIEINFKVKNSWELENLKESVTCGLFLQRYRLWLKQNGFDIPPEANFESTLTIKDSELTAHFKEPEQIIKEDSYSKEAEIIEVLANPDDLHRADIVEELADGKSPAHIAIGFMSASIVKHMMSSLMPKLQAKHVLDEEEVEKLTTSNKASDMECSDCVLHLNLLLQKKTDIQIMKFVQVMQEEEMTANLATLIQRVLMKCRDAQPPTRKTILLLVTMPNGTTVWMDAGNTDTRIEDLTRQIVDEEMTKNMSANMIKLSFAGKVLENGHTLADYNITDMCVLDVIKAPGKTSDFAVSTKYSSQSKMSEIQFTELSQRYWVVDTLDIAVYPAGRLYHHDNLLWCCSGDKLTVVSLDCKPTREIALDRFFRATSVVFTDSGDFLVAGLAGIHLFNQTGKHVKEILGHEISDMCMSNNKVYALDGDAHILHVLTQTEKNTWNTETLKLNDIEPERYFIMQYTLLVTDKIYVAEYEESIIHVFNLEGKLLKKIDVKAVDPSVYHPRLCGFDSDGNILIASGTHLFTLSVDFQIKRKADLQGADGRVRDVVVHDGGKTVFALDHRGVKKFVSIEDSK